MAVTIINDSFELPEDSKTVPLAVFANDSDSNDATLSITQYSQPQHGTLVLSDNVLFYTPDTNFDGDDSFDYTASNNSGDTGSATVSLYVEPSHAQPQSTIDNRIDPELTPSGLSITVSKYARINSGSRVMMTMATERDRIFVVTNGFEDNDNFIYELKKDTNDVPFTELFFDFGDVFDDLPFNITKDDAIHRGVRGLAFHPDFADASRPGYGKLYFSAMIDKPPSGYSGDVHYISLPPNHLRDSTVAELTYDFSSGEIDPSSYREVFRIGIPQPSHHPIKEIRFNPYAIPGDEDYGLLYVAHGDSMKNGQTVAGNASQNNDGLGKMIRVNPLENQSAGEPYTTPTSNPFYGSGQYPDEAWALGLRNEHTFYFNKAPDGSVHLIATGVGYNNIDEVNIITAGANLGWGLREGPFVVKEKGTNTEGLLPLPDNDWENGYTYPATFVAHDGPIGKGGDVGQALSGAFVVDNGSALDGQFIFADFSKVSNFYHVSFDDLLNAKTQLNQGENPAALTWVNPSELTILENHDGDASTTPIVRSSFLPIVDHFRSDVRFGRGPDGEMYILNKRDKWIYIVEDSLPGVGPDVPPPDSPSEYDFMFGDSAYVIGTPGLTWEEAQAEGVAMDGNLIVINSQAEQDFVMQNIADGINPIWIGLEDKDDDGVFKWVNNDPVNYTNWHNGGPDGFKDYVAISFVDGGWDDQRNDATSFHNNGWTQGNIPITVIELDAPVTFKAVDDSYSGTADNVIEITSFGSQLGIITNDPFPGDEPFIISVNGDPMDDGIVEGQPIAISAGSNGGVFTIQADGALHFDPNGEFDVLTEDESEVTSVSYTLQEPDTLETSTASVFVTVEGVGPPVGNPTPTPMPTSAPSPNPVPGEVVFEGSAYHYVQQTITWEGAKILAESRGGHLVVINSQAEQDFIMSTFSDGSSPIWIGLEDKDDDGVFHWVNGDPVTYTNWHNGGPDGVKDYVAISFVDGGWDDQRNDASSFNINGWTQGNTPIVVIERPIVSETVSNTMRDRALNSMRGVEIMPANVTLTILEGCGDDQRTDLTASLNKNWALGRQALSTVETISGPSITIPHKNAAGKSVFGRNVVPGSIDLDAETTTTCVASQGHHDSTVDQSHMYGQLDFVLSLFLAACLSCV